MPKHGVLEESAEQFGQVVTELLDAATKRALQGLNIAQLAQGEDILEIDVAIPFRIKVHSGKNKSLMADGPPGTRCCTCTRDAGGEVHCWPSDTACC